jgi:hypothetical protein
LRVAVAVEVFGLDRSRRREIGIGVGVAVEVWLVSDLSRVLVVGWWGCYIVVAAVAVGILDIVSCYNMTVEAVVAVFLVVVVVEAVVCMELGLDLEQRNEGAEGQAEEQTEGLEDRPTDSVHLLCLHKRSVRTSHP